MTAYVVWAALVTGAVALIVSIYNAWSAEKTRRSQASTDFKLLRAKIDAEYNLAIKKIDADTQSSMSDRAWADYGLRRDIYLSIARLIDCLYSNGNKDRKVEFHEAARQLRLIGSDRVVTALNAMTAAIKNGDDATPAFAALFNAMRVDIRKFHSLPPEGTELGDDAFPIES